MREISSLMQNTKKAVFFIRGAWTKSCQFLKKLNVRASLPPTCRYHKSPNFFEPTDLKLDVCMTDRLAGRLEQSHLQKRHRGQVFTHKTDTMIAIYHSDDDWWEATYRCHRPIRPSCCVHLAWRLAGHQQKLRR